MTIKKINRFSFLVLAGLIAFQSFSFAGPGSSGGGPAIVCRGADGRIASARLLDLYEGEIRLGIAIPRSNDSADSQLMGALERLKRFDSFLAIDVTEALAKVMTKVTFLPAGVIMAPGVDLGDSYAAIIPEQCELAYAGYFEKDGTLRISRTIYDKFDATDRAALFLHEALYAVARATGNAKNSLPTRQANAVLFAREDHLAPWSDVAPFFSWLQRLSDYQLNETTIVKAATLPAPTDQLRVTIKGRERGAKFLSSILFYGECWTSGGTRHAFELLDLPSEESLLLPVHPQVKLPSADCRLLRFNISYIRTSDAADIQVVLGGYPLFSGPLSEKTPRGDIHFDRTIVIYSQPQAIIPAIPN